MAEPQTPPTEPTEADRLAAENQRLRTELAALEQQQVAEKGPAQGTKVCFQKHGELFCRPATIASPGFTERVKRPEGVALHALIDYGEPPWIKQRDGAPMHHTFQTDRPWNPTGAEETWHLLDECPRAGTPACPYGVRGIEQAP